MGRRDQSLDALLRFGETHHARWEQDPGSFGLDPKREQAWWDKVKTAREKLAAAVAARQAARAATLALRAAERELRRDTGAIVGQVRAFAGYGFLDHESEDQTLARAGLDPYRKRGPRRRAA